MSYAFPGEGALDYFPCRYGTSRLLFRGPRRSLERPFIAVLGGTETYGKYVPDPFADLVEDELGMSVVNLGCMNAGPDVFLNDPGILDIVNKSEATVLQLVGAQNATNRYYAVHPRRNDRFLHATPLLQSIFREVDFTEFNFTRHMLQALQAVSPDRFEVLAEELRSTWVLRIRDLLSQISGRKVVLWMADQPPARPGSRADLRLEPLLVDSEMVGTIRRSADDYVESICAHEGLEGKSFSPLECLAAAGLPGPLAHRQTSGLLSASLKKFV